MLRSTDDFYTSKDEPNKSCLLALRSVIIALDKEVSETTKYNMPCFCYKQKMFCYLWIDKKTYDPYILLVEGKYLNHPQLEEGNRSRMKIFRVDPTKDLPITTLKALLNEALNLYRKGIIKIR